MSVIEATDADFATATVTGKPVLVDFWAPWCGPCKQFEPTLREIAEENPDVVVVKVNADEARATTLAFGVQSVPTLYVLDGSGIPVRQFVGPQSKQTLVAALRDA